VNEVTPCSVVTEAGAVVCPALFRLVFRVAKNSALVAFAVGKLALFAVAATPVLDERPA